MELYLTGADVSENGILSLCSVISSREKARRLMTAGLCF